MKYLISLIFIATYIGNFPIGYSATSPLYMNFIYMFQHANLLHLLLNIISLFSFITLLQKFIPIWRLFLYMYLPALCAAFGSSQITPTIGASGMVYGLVGVYFILSILGRKMRITDKKKFFSWVALIFVSSLLTVFNPHINNLNHLIAFCLGIMFGIAENFITLKQ